MSSCKLAILEITQCDRRPRYLEAWIQMSPIAALVHPEFDIYILGVSNLINQKQKRLVCACPVHHFWGKVIP